MSRTSGSKRSRSSIDSHKSSPNKKVKQEPIGDTDPAQNPFAKIRGNSPKRSPNKGHNPFGTGSGSDTNGKSNEKNLNVKKVESTSPSKINKTVDKPKQNGTTQVKKEPNNSNSNSGNKKNTVSATAKVDKKHESHPIKSELKEANKNEKEAESKKTSKKSENVSIKKAKKNEPSKPEPKKPKASSNDSTKSLPKPAKVSPKREKSKKKDSENSVKVKVEKIESPRIRVKSEPKEPHSQPEIISLIEDKIDDTETEIAQYKDSLTETKMDADAKHFIYSEIKALRRKEEQLRKEKELLLQKDLILLRGTIPEDEFN